MFNPLTYSGPDCAIPLTEPLLVKIKQANQGRSSIRKSIKQGAAPSATLANGECF